MEWFDYRLLYHNLKPRRSVNSLGMDETNKLWLPTLVFENTKSTEITMADMKTEVTISREGNFTYSTDDVVDEIMIFEGSNNRLTFQQVYTKTFKCEYKLQLYPFDTQVCCSN